MLALANDTRVERLILTHASPAYERPGLKERAIADIAQAYGGAVFFPDELQTIRLPHTHCSADAREPDPGLEKR